MSLTIERDADTFIVVSDDRNAENAALGDAIDAAAPHILGSFENTEVDDDGLLRWRVPKEDWDSLIEVLEEISSRAVCDPEQMARAEQIVNDALDEDGR